MTSIFDNHSNGQLADELGEVRCEISALQTREKVLRAEFVKRGLAQASGNRFTVTRIDATRWSLETAKVKEEMGEDWFSARCRLSPTVTLRHTPVVQAALAVAAE